MSEKKANKKDNQAGRLPERSSPFDSIKRVAEDGSEYWSARELAKILGYSQWQKFKNAIAKAQTSAKNSGYEVDDHFTRVGEMVTIGSGARREVEDYYLSRYACYLLIENSDPAKPIVALGQSYFAEQTRRAELTANFDALPEDQKRLYLRSEIAVHNTQLADAARQAGVIGPNDFATFQDHGYAGLYNGLKAADIHSRKHLSPKEHILDHMESDELAANIFRASQTKQKLERDGIRGKGAANQTHYEMGKKVRTFIGEVGGTMPEDLPTPEESIKQLEQKEQKRLHERLQPKLFGDD